MISVVLYYRGISLDGTEGIPAVFERPVANRVFARCRVLGSTGRLSCSDTDRVFQPSIILLSVSISIFVVMRPHRSYDPDISVAPTTVRVGCMLSYDCVFSLVANVRGVQLDSHPFQRRCPRRCPPRLCNLDTSSYLLCVVGLASAEAITNYSTR